MIKSRAAGAGRTSAQASEPHAAESGGFLSVTGRGDPNRGQVGSRGMMLQDIIAR